MQCSATFICSSTTVRFLGPHTTQRRHCWCSSVFHAFRRLSEDWLLISVLVDTGLPSWVWSYILLDIVSCQFCLQIRKKCPVFVYGKKHEQCDANSSTLNNENDINIYNANKLGSIANDDHPCLDEEPCIWLVYIVLCTIGIGSGWLRAVIVPFGADQVVFNVDSLTLMFYIFQNCRKGLKY